MAEMTHEGYLQLLAEIKTVIDQLVGVESRKLDAVHSADLPAVDECIRQEQAISLTLRSLEQRRGKMLQALGLAGVNLSALAGHFPPELKGQAAKAAEVLRSSYADYNSVSSAARMALERGLRELDQLLGGADTTQTGDRQPARTALHSVPTERGAAAKPPEGETPHKKLDFGA